LVRDAPYHRRRPGKSAKRVSETGRSSIPEAPVIDREAAAYWITRRSLSSGGALRRPGGG